MESGDAIIEAEVSLDGDALEQEATRRREDRGLKSAEIAKPGVDISSKRSHTDPEVDETSALLPRNEVTAGDPSSDEDPSWPQGDEFAHLPWFKRPSILWMLLPFSIMACAFGGMISPKINLILDLVCREYMSDRVIWDPGYTMIPVDFNGGRNDQCRVPEVQSRVSMLMLWGSLLGGGFSAISSPKLGALSDRYGRKLILIITSIGTICGEAITICAATYPESFPVNLLLLGFAIDGITGTFIVAMAIANAYAADCTSPAKRGVAFGYFHSCLFFGVAIGPILAGYIVQATGSIVVIFYVMMVAHICFVFFVAFVVPESLSKKRQLAAREKHDAAYRQHSQDRDWVDRLRAMNPLGPLKILWPTGPGSSLALRRNLILLAAIDTIAFGVAMGSMTVIITYTNYMFGWQTFESGRFLTIVNSCRVFCLLVILPALTRLVRGPAKMSKSRKATGSDLFDLSMIRFALFFDSIGFLCYTLARSGAALTLAGAVAAVGGIGSPTLQSSLTKHVPADQTGQLLGATSLLHALARVVAPTAFNAIYAETVKTFPQTVFVCLASLFGFAFLISWFLKTHLYLDESAAAAEAEPNEEVRDTGEHRTGTPVVGSILALFSALAARLKIGSR